MGAWIRDSQRMQKRRTQAASYPRLEVLCGPFALEAMASKQDGRWKIPTRLALFECRPAVSTTTRTAALH
jgi:hypothetical protein